MDLVIADWINAFGYAHPMHCPEIFNKQQQHRIKEMLIEGETIVYQGYENFAILDLLDLGYSISDLSMRHRKSIQYLDELGKTRMYHPDIVIEKDKRIIEVKSSYTYEVDYVKLGNVKPAVEALGFKFECWIY